MAYSFYFNDIYKLWRIRFILTIFTKKVLFKFLKYYTREM